MLTSKRPPVENPRLPEFENGSRHACRAGEKKAELEDWFDEDVDEDDDWMGAFWDEEAPSDN